MLALRVKINDESAVTAGAEDLGVLNAIVTAGGRLGQQSQLGRADATTHIHLTLAGLTAREAALPNEHLHWVSLRELNVGDKIVVEILETDAADNIESGTVADKRESDEREYFEHSKKVYFELRSKYEHDAPVVPGAA